MKGLFAWAGFPARPRSATTAKSASSARRSTIIGSVDAGDRRHHFGLDRAARRQLRRRRGDIAPLALVIVAFIGLRTMLYGADVAGYPSLMWGRKNDAADAAALCVAGTRPETRFVPIKSVEQQAVLALHAARVAAGQAGDDAGECPARPGSRVRSHRAHVRTPVGRYAGALATSAPTISPRPPSRALMARLQGLDWQRIDDVILGCANQAGEDNRNVARMAAPGRPPGRDRRGNREPSLRLRTPGRGQAAHAIRAGEGEFTSRAGSRA